MDTNELKIVPYIRKNALHSSDPDFPVKIRFEILKRYTDLVCQGCIPSSLIVGQGGLGKTFLVTQRFKENRIRDITTLYNDAMMNGTPLDHLAPGFVHVKGNTTPKGLYELLYHNRGSQRILLLDDCSRAFSDHMSLENLKAATDSYAERHVSWLKTNERISEIPPSFVFEGRVIIITNRPLANIDPALRTRSACADITLTVS